MEFVLKTPKLVYKQGEPIRITLEAHNKGEATAEIPSILPWRASSNAPDLVINGPSEKMIQTPLPFDASIYPKNIVNEKPIVIKPGQSLVLIDVDLTKVGGSIHVGKNAGKPTKNLKPHLTRGRYKVWCRVYSYKTDAAVEFEIAD